MHRFDSRRALLLVALWMAAGNGLPGMAQSSSRWGGMQAIGPDTISDVAAKVGPSVVNILVNGASARAATSYAPRQTDAAKRLRRFYGLDGPSAADDPQTLIHGSGVIVRADGYILTNVHVLENASKVTVTLQDGRSFEGQILARDRFTDLALLRIQAKDLSVANFASPDQVRLGDWVIAIGNQVGLGQTITQGIISAVGREAKGFEKSFGARTGAVHFLQTDAAINPGSSGGPLVNLRGDILGINTFIRDDAQNISFAIPANIAKDVADKLIAGGEIAHPYIGIVMKEPDKASAGVPGVEVTEVKPRSPASLAGITPGDVILMLGETPVASSDDVSMTVAKCRVGDNIKLKVRHGGSDKLVDVRIERLPESGE